MHSNDFEEAFGLFLESRDYEEAENYLFDLVRLSFEAGWKAAGGEYPVPQRLFEVIRSPKPKQISLIDTSSVTTGVVPPSPQGEG